MDDERQERFRVLYVSARPRIVAYALRRTRSAEDAADVVAETFAVAWRRIDDVPEGDDAVLWLYATARRVLANERRRGRRRTDLVSRIGSVLFEHGASVEPPDGTALVAVSALRSLDGDDRELLMLTAWEGLDAADVGRVLGCTPGAARIRLHRARRRLDAVIAALTSEDPGERHPDLAGRRGNEGAVLGCAEEEA
jgi:RNA polymerase sigma-70 factor (ECF subfamily)